MRSKQRKPPASVKEKAPVWRIVDEVLLGLWLLLIAAQCMVIYMPAVSYPVDLSSYYLGMLGLSILWGLMRLWLGRSSLSS